MQSIRDFLNILEDIQQQTQSVEWVRPKGTSDYAVVWIDIAKLDASWKNDYGFHVGPGGEGGIRDRYHRFGEWLKLGKPVEMPMVSLTDRSKIVAFGNGRHRFAWMRDHGATSLPVVVYKDQEQEFKRRFAASEHQTVLHEGLSYAAGDYGCWITDTGKVIPTHADGEHYPVIHQHFGAHTDENNSEYETAMQAGWIRVVSFALTDGTNHHEFSADTYGHYTSERALRVLFRMVADVESELYFHTDELLGIQTGHHSAREFVSGVRRALSGASAPRVLSESDSTYMYWIDADGHMMDCSGSTHEEVAGRELDIDDDTAHEQAYNLGWIRVLAEGPEFGADWTDATSLALRSLAKLVREVEDFNTYYFDGDAFHNKTMAVAHLNRLSRGSLNEGREDRPFIDAHRTGNTIEIEMMHVPRHMRRKGEGSRFYQEWESKLPKDITLVRLWAADTDGNGKSVGFWESLGFDFCYTAADADDYDPSQDIWWWMHKGVNGHETPKPQLVEPDEDEIKESVAPSTAEMNAVRDEFWDENYSISFEPNFPLDYIPEVEHRAGWFISEYKKALADADEEWRADMEKKFVGRDVRPVALFVDEDGEVKVVADGNHRIGAALARGETTIPAFVASDHALDEKAPPGIKAKRFLRKAKKDFKKRYGDDWESRLYGTAWKMFGSRE